MIDKNSDGFLEVDDMLALYADDIGEMEIFKRQIFSSYFRTGRVD